MSNTLILQTNYPNACLKMVFEHQTDRWSHRLIVAGKELETTILRSLEGDADQPWPPSPPLQDASLHRLETGEAVLAVGMAGKSHWSASFSVSAGSILADLACLNKTKPPQDADSIGSRYEIAQNVKVTRKADGRTELRLGSCRLAISPVLEKDWSTRLEHDDQLILRPHELSTEPGRPTRWGYRLNLIDAA